MWVEQAVLDEMVLEMLPSGPFGRLHLAVLDRSEAPIACPSCHEPMHPTEVHQVKLDRCPKHGIWFDKHELATALLRIGDPALAPPIVSFADSPTPPVLRARPALVFWIHTPGQAIREVRLDPDIIKIGRLASSHLQIDDPRVARMHAVIECTHEAVTLIDLGSADGTLVNGDRVTRHTLETGDTLTLGATTIDVQIVP